MFRQLPQKSSSSNAKFRIRSDSTNPKSSLLPIKNETVINHPHDHTHKKCSHNHEKIPNAQFKRTCHGEKCSKKEKKPIVISKGEIIFAKPKIHLPKIKNRDFISDPIFQQKVIKDLLSLVEKKDKPHLIEVKDEIFKSFKFEKKKVDIICNYIDSILTNTNKTHDEVKKTLDYMQETRDKCQILDDQMDEFLEGVRRSLILEKTKDS